MLETANRDNVILGTQRSIAQAVGVSVPTVNSTIKSLVSCNLLKMMQQGVYVLNPDVIFKGTRNNRMNVLLQYTSNTAEAPAEPKKKRGRKKKVSTEVATTDETLQEQIKLD